MIHPVLGARPTRVHPEPMQRPRFGNDGPAVPPEFAEMVLYPPEKLTAKTYLATTLEQAIAKACFNNKVSATDPKVADDLDVAAKTCPHQDHGIAKEYIYRKALAIRLAAFGDTHPKVGESYLNIAKVLRYSQLGDNTDQNRWMPMMEKALSMLEPNSLAAADAHYQLAEGTDDFTFIEPDKIKTLNDVAGRLMHGVKLKYTPEREGHLVKAMEILAKTKGFYSPQLYPVLRDLRSIYTYVDAKPQIERIDAHIDLIGQNLEIDRLSAEKQAITDKITAALDVRSNTLRKYEALGKDQ